MDQFQFQCHDITSLTQLELINLLLIASSLASGEIMENLHVYSKGFYMGIQRGKSVHVISFTLIVYLHPQLHVQDAYDSMSTSSGSK